MGLCKFKTSEIKRCIQHALNSTKWSMGWCEDAPSPAIFFVHDHGVYIMSNGEPKDKDGEETNVAYAKGCDPKKDEDYYEEARHLVGGDDFAETIPVTADTLNRCDLYEEFHIKVLKTKMEMIFVKPKKAKV
jgi:hypothetical protein